MVYQPTAPPCAANMAGAAGSQTNRALPSQKPVTTVTAVTRLLQMSMEEFSASDYMVEIAVPWWDETLWWVARPEGVQQLEREGVERGRIWTATELTNLSGIEGLRQDDVRTIGTLKTRLDCIIRDVESLPAAVDSESDHPRECIACHERRFWISSHGETFCGTCHPPASPSLVDRWIDADCEASS